MRSHFYPLTPLREQKAPSVTKGTMRSHFLMSSAAMACALSAATTMMPGVCSGQMTAADYATDPTYSGGWFAGRNVPGNEQLGADRNVVDTYEPLFQQRSC